MSEQVGLTARGGPRLWGEWHVRSYHSGTMNVEIKSLLRKPWLYVFADHAADEDRQQRERYQMCEQLAAFLNGGARPAWLADMIRTSGTVAVSLAGASISAIGPVIDRDPPNLDWVDDESDDAKDDRARLMDALFFDKEGGR